MVKNEQAQFCPDGVIAMVGNPKILADACSAN
jgi:hypothetical protein